jgi:hypothetical protein
MSAPLLAVTLATVLGCGVVGAALAAAGALTVAVHVA